MTSFIVKEESETIRHFKLSKCTPFYLKPQGSEEMCLSLEHGLEHQNPSKTSEKMGYFDRLQFRYTFYRPQTKRLRARKIGFSLKYGKLGFFFTRHFVPRSPFGQRAMRQRGYGLRLLIFKSRSGSDKKRRNRLQ